MTFGIVFIMGCAKIVSLIVSAVKSFSSSFEAPYLTLFIPSLIHFTLVFLPFFHRRDICNPYVD